MFGTDKLQIIHKNPRMTTYSFRKLDRDKNRRGRLKDLKAAFATMEKT